MKAGRASATALLIARSTLVSSGVPAWSALFDPRAVRLCEEFIRDHHPLGGLRARIYRQPWYRGLLGIMERLTLPGVQLHYALRKRRIEETVRAALAEGFGNVQVSGAGFDSLAWRLAMDHPGARFLEIDHPATQQAKIATFQRLGSLPDNLHFRARDFESAEDAGFAAPALDPARDTIVVAEGLLMYLSETRVRQFFEQLQERHTGRLRVLFTFMIPDPSGRIRFHHSSRLVGLWLKLKGEPFTWGLAPSDARAFLDGLRFELIETTGHDDLRRYYLRGGAAADSQLAVGEWLALAEAKRP